jgi:hypothetical protein
MVMPRLRMWDSPVFVDVREVVEFLGQVFEVSELFPSSSIFYIPSSVLVCTPPWGSLIRDPLSFFISSLRIDCPMVVYANKLFAVCFLRD